MYPVFCQAKNEQNTKCFLVQNYLLTFPLPGAIIQSERGKNPRCKGENEMNHITYTDRYFGENLQRMENTCRSKVYKTYYAHTPSGLKQYARVWNTRLNKMVDIRLDTDLVAVID
jgi:hypothetical protein